MTPWRLQIEELQLLYHSLLPGESLHFPQNAEVWNEIIATGEPNWEGSWQDLCCQVQLQNGSIWFDIWWAFGYPGDDEWDISINGENGIITRKKQEEVSQVFKMKKHEMMQLSYPTYQMLSLHLMPLVPGEQDKADDDDTRILVESQREKPNPSSSSTSWHALLTSHHLISPNKRRSMQQWSASFRISGFAKVGYPGILYATGRKEDVDEFVKNVKAMQWKALRVRFIEELGEENGKGKPEEGLVGWTEYDKIGQVIERMRDLGREKYIVEYGIGSSTANST